MLAGRFRLVAPWRLYSGRSWRGVVGGRRSTHVDGPTVGSLGWDGGRSPLVIVPPAGAAKCGTTSRRPAAVVVELAHGPRKQRCHAPDGDPEHDRASNGETQRDTQPHAGADTDPHPDPVTHSHANPDPNADTDANSNA